MVDLRVFGLCMLSEAFTYGVHEFRAVPLILKMLKLHMASSVPCFKSDNGSIGQVKENNISRVLTT
jgi:hypothetical protein